MSDLSRRVVKSSVDWSSAGLRLIDLLAGRFTYRSAAEWEERIASGEITVNGRSVPPDTRLELHDIIEYHPADIVEPPADLNYRIVYEDDTLLIVDKPGNLCMHPSGPFFKHTLWHLLTSRCGEVHFLSRLDRETSGLLVATKTAAAAAAMNRNRQGIRKEYLAVVHGSFTTEITARGFLFSDPESSVRKKRRFAAELPPGAIKVEGAETGFFPVKEKNGFSLVRALPFTGRMHQIRATLFSLGFPMVGDKLYGLDEGCFLRLRQDALTAEDRKNLIFSRQGLHSAYLEICHPVSGEILKFSSELPAELAAVFTDGDNN